MLASVALVALVGSSSPVPSYLRPVDNPPSKLTAEADNGIRPFVDPDDLSFNPPGWDDKTTPSEQDDGTKPKNVGDRANVAGSLGIPGIVLKAYQNAAGKLAKSDPGCHLTWQMLAGIGKIESNHARSSVTKNGDTTSPILGPQLDGSRWASISDSDGGRLDGDSVWDRAVGPMQFIPTSWNRFASDGNGDGVASPHNVFDASYASAHYLCVGSRDLSNRADLTAAIYSYNHSDSYVALVLSWIDAYTQGTVVATGDRNDKQIVASDPIPPLGDNDPNQASPEPNPPPKPPASDPPKEPTNPPTSDPPTSEPPGPTPTRTPPTTTPTTTPTPDETPTPTPTPTPTVTCTPTPTPTPTGSPTPDDQISPSPSPSSPTPGPAQTQSPSPTPSPVEDPEPTPTPTPTPSPTCTPTPAPN
jgi:hypothetical protein